jgi:hypothetical protein
VVDDSDYKQRQANLASAEYRGIHSAYGRSIGHKFAAANMHSPRKNRIEFTQRLALCSVMASIADAHATKSPVAHPSNPLRARQVETADRNARGEVHAVS